MVDLLHPRAGERILDVGCGTGRLTEQIAAAGADAVGLDASAEMLDGARSAYPDLAFVRADARRFSFAEPFDAVFSNAALHWIPEQDAVLESVASALRPGGRFVAELGRTGNVQSIVDAVTDVAATRGYDVESPWYFPSVGGYATKLETHGFEVRYGALFDRPTKLDGGTEGLASWLGLFGDGLLSPVPADERREVVAAVEDRLRDGQFENGNWIADYQRLRVVAAFDP